MARDAFTTRYRHGKKKRRETGTGLPARWGRAHGPTVGQPPQPLLAGFLAGSGSGLGSSLHLPVAGSFSLHSSVLTAPDVLPPQPLPAAGFCTSLALPAPGVVPPQPLPAACAPGTLTPPALIRPATPSPASSFFRSLVFMLPSLSE